MIMLFGVNGKVFGVDQGYYGGQGGDADHIFDVSIALEDDHMNPESKSDLEEAIRLVKGSSLPQK